MLSDLDCLDIMSSKQWGYPMLQETCSWITALRIHKKSMSLPMYLLCKKYARRYSVFTRLGNTITELLFDGATT